MRIRCGFAFYLFYEGVEWQGFYEFYEVIVRLLKDLFKTN